MLKGYEKLREVKNNIIHDLCILALKKKKVLIRNGSIQRTFIPSQIFVETINSIIKKKFFKNSIINIIYKNFSLKSIAQIIQKRCKLRLNLKVDIIIKKFNKKNIFTIYGNPNLIVKKKVVIKNYLKDHRVFMSSVIAALSFGGNWKIHDKDSINT